MYICLCTCICTCAPIHPPPVPWVGHDLVSHAVLAAVLEPVQELYVGDVLVGRLHRAASHELSQVLLLQTQAKVGQHRQEVVMTHLEHRKLS